MAQRKVNKVSSENYDEGRKQENNSTPKYQEEPSMSALIIWNISKAIEKNPCLDLKCAIHNAQDRLERESCDVSALISNHPDERHLVCAVLAWKQLGHTNTDSLYRFIETRRNEDQSILSQKSVNKDICSVNTIDFTPKQRSCITTKESKYSKGVDSASFDIHSLTGPVLKLPMETKIVMRLENAPKSRPTPNNPQKPLDKNIKSKIDEACCLESGCIEQLAQLDAATTQLRSRATKLARREAERVELLERAEAAWKDLELGYQRRLALAEEKEEDMTRQIQTQIEERNSYKNVCSTLLQLLKDKQNAAEKAREKLKEVEKEVCDRACVRLRLSEESAREDAILAEHQCKAAQLDRDLQFKEEQNRRKVSCLESEVESARALIHETERAMRSELCALRDQIAQLSTQLLSEDSDISRVKEELDDLRKEKMELVEDLNGCQMMCDKRMQGKMEELKKKREQLRELKERVIECKCKMPVDVSVEVKRTPSLAALCRCTPEDKTLDSCSCTSLRSRLLSNLLSDLFSGLQTELGSTGATMPCQLLKCLEDKHNWERESIVKTNLRSFFSKLLIGELNIAIATSIENYHAKWVGASCADAARPIPDVSGVENEGWQERALERRAQKLASKLAEQMFKERAEALIKRAKDIVSSGPPPCECTTKTHQETMFPCLLGPTMKRANNVPSTHPVSLESGASSPTYWKRTLHDVTQLRAQVEDLKKGVVKKEDLDNMERKLAKMVQCAVKDDSPDPEAAIPVGKNNYVEEKSSQKYNRSHQSNHVDETKKQINSNKISTIKKKKPDVNSNTKNNNKCNVIQNQNKDKNFGKTYKRPQSFAVNMCLCGSQQDPHNKLGPLPRFKLEQQRSPDKEHTNIFKQIPIKEMIWEIPIVKQSKPIDISKENTTLKNSMTSVQLSCRSDCACFNRVPSNTSIDMLLKTLAKWKHDLTDSQDKTIIFPTKKTDVDASHKKYETVDIQEEAQKDNIKPAMYSKFSNSNNDTVISFNLSAQMEENFTDCEHHLPVTTESEYMGAVNLEKSTEKICKCPKNNAEINSNFTFECVNSCNCYNQLHKFKNNCIVQPDESIISNASKKEQPTKLLTLTRKPKSLNTDKIQFIDRNSYPESDHKISPRKSLVQSLRDPHDNYDKTAHPEMQIEKDKNMSRSEYASELSHVIKTSKLFQSECDYRIKFLGVTLTNEVGDVLKRELNDCNNNKEQCSNQKLATRHGEEHEYKRKSIQSITMDKLNEKHLNRPTCQCNVNFDEFKHFVGNALYKQHGGDHSTNEDKALDVQSFKESLNKTEEHCKCCNRTDKEESHELEVNTFLLLEEHLKLKLEEVKLNSQLSSLPPGEEDKLFSTILHKIKQLITDRTSKVACKCQLNSQTSGSWNRAYSLLQEYLKAKIQRVQCHCDSAKLSSENVLPDVTDKVCNLIESDFQRLRDIYKQNNIAISFNNQEKTKNVSDNTLRLKMEVENVLISDIITEDTKVFTTGAIRLGADIEEKPCLNNENDYKSSKQNSNTSLIATQNNYSQIPLNFRTDTKSCATIEQQKLNMKLENSHDWPSDDIVVPCDIANYHSRENISIEAFNLQCYKDIRKEEAHQCTSMISFKNNNFESESGALKVNSIAEERNEHLQNKTKKYRFDETRTDITDQPYIGYTVNCSCDQTLGSCVCSRSIIEGNGNNINSVWKSYTSRKLNNENVSYIMSNVYKERPSKNFVEVYDDPSVHNMTKLEKVDYSQQKSTLCDTKTNVYNEIEITLKDSMDRFQKHLKNNASNTFNAGMLTSDADYNTDETLEWYECGSQPFDNQRVSKLRSVHFPISENFTIVTRDAFADTTNMKSSKSLPRCCNCDMVPICHVKLLMENIENKLEHADCTCDSLSSKVCPVHANNLD